MVSSDSYVQDSDGLFNSLALKLFFDNKDGLKEMTFN